MNSVRLYKATAKNQYLTFVVFFWGVYLRKHHGACGRNTGTSSHSGQCSVTPGSKKLWDCFQ